VGQPWFEAVRLSKDVAGKQYGCCSCHCHIINTTFLHLSIIALTQGPEMEGRKDKELLRIH
jgi:hypothetical protein